MAALRDAPRGRHQAVHSKPAVAGCWSAPVPGRSNVLQASRLNFSESSVVSPLLRPRTGALRILQAGPRQLPGGLRPHDRLEKARHFAGLLTKQKPDQPPKKHHEQSEKENGREHHLV
jgi:hypothetical protein